MRQESVHLLDIDIPAIARRRFVAVALPA